MSKIQAALAKCVDDVTALLGALTEPNSRCSPQDVEQVLLNFYSKSWLLPELNDAQNAALATVSCIPLWELLNLFSGMFTPVSGASKAVAIALLTTLYPKARDRRCLFQQPEVVGVDYANSVPLFTPVPVSTEVVGAVHGGTEAFRRCASLVRNPIAAQTRALKDRAGVVALLSTFVTNVIPSCHFVATADESRRTTSASCVFQVGGEVSSGLLPFKVFAQTLWNYLLLAEQLSCPEGKELRKVVTTSSWAAQAITVNGKAISYASLVSPIVDACAICLSTSSAPSPTTDNKPLIEPAVLRAIMASHQRPSEEVEIDFSSPCPLKTLPVLRVPIADDMEEHVGEQLLSSIPQEIDFFATSATCRDCDQLTMLCRNLLFAPVRVRTSSSHRIDLRISTQLNFDRKRPRGDDDAPSLLPVTLALSDTLSEAQTTTTLLERLCVQWKRDSAMAAE